MGRSHGDGLAVRLSIALQLQSRLNLRGYLRLEGGVGQVDGLLGGGDGIVEAAGGGVGSGEGIEIGGHSIVGEFAGLLRQSHRLNRVAAVRGCKRRQQPGQIVL